MLSEGFCQKVHVLIKKWVYYLYLHRSKDAIITNKMNFSLFLIIFENTLLVYWFGIVINEYLVASLKGESRYRRTNFYCFVAWYCWFRKTSQLVINYHSELTLSSQMNFVHRVWLAGDTKVTTVVIFRKLKKFSFRWGIICNIKLNCF